MIINRPNHFVFALLVLLSITWVKVNAQNQADIKDRYCIGVNQGYDSWSHCGGAPAYDSVRIRINGKEDMEMVIEKNYLNQIKFFDFTIKGTSLDTLYINGTTKLESIEAFYCKHFTLFDGPR